MALFVTMLVLVLLFTARLTLCRRKRWRPVTALLMPLPMAICGNVMFSAGTSHDTTETVVSARYDSVGARETRIESMVTSESEVVTQAAAFVAGMGVLFTLGLLAWGTVFLACLLRRVGPRSPEGPG